MDNETVKELAMNGQFFELEQEGKMEKGVKWFIQKLAHAKDREKNGKPHDKAPSPFMLFLLDAADIELQQEFILTRAKEWLKAQPPPPPPVVEAEISLSMSDSDEFQDIEVKVKVEKSADGGVSITKKGILGDESVEVDPFQAMEIDAPPVVSPASKPAQTKKFIIPTSSLVPLSPLPKPMMPIPRDVDESSSSNNAIAGKASKNKKVVKSSSSSSASKKKEKVGAMKPRKVKDPFAPKAKKSAYDYFAIDKRPQLKLEEPELKPQEVLSSIGSAWRVLAEADKSPFQAKAATDAQRYKAEMDTYRISHPDASSKSKSRSTSTKEGSKKKKAKTTFAVAAVADESSSEEDADAEACDTGTRSPPAVGTKRSARLKSSASEAVSGDDTDVSASDVDDDANAGIAKPKSADSKVPKNPLTKTAVLKQHKSRVAKAIKASESIPKGIKQEDLTQADDLLHTEITEVETVPFPVDYCPLEGASAVLILRPYQDFLSSFTEMGNLADEKREAIERPCQSTGNVLRGVVCRIAVNDDDVLRGTSTISIRDSIGTMHSVLFVSFSSTLLRSDEFLIDADRFDKSLKQPILRFGAQVRKLFAAEDGSRGIWEEGSVYFVSPTLLTDPYQSMRVVWLSQEKETEDWVFAYTQTDCIVSPWEIEASVYVLEDHNLRSQTLPSVLRIGALTPGSVLDYFRSSDFSDIFRYRVQQSDEYCAMFPNKDDQLDLHVISGWLNQGRYHGDRNTPSAVIGIATLFRDLDLMVLNAKRFNQCNAAFLPWRQADMAEHSLKRLRIELVAAHPELSVALLESLAGGAGTRQSLQSDLAAEI